MNQLCETCPIADCASELSANTAEEEIALSAASSLSDELVNEMDGAESLSPEAIQEVKEAEIDAWGESEEAEILERHPSLVQATYQCAQMRRRPDHETTD